MALIIGTPGSDTQLLGLPDEDDAIYGDVGEPDLELTVLGGDDRIFGRGGDDGISGDAPIITATGIGGNDVISGGAGDDWLWGDADFQLAGRGGNDTLRQDAGSGRLVGDATNLLTGAVGGNDTLVGAGVLVGDGYEMANATGGADFLDASRAAIECSLWGDCTVILDGTSRAGADRLLGGSAGDFLFGDAFMLDGVNGAKDTLNGNSGNDVLYGEARFLAGTARGAGDVLVGGSGDDTIYGDAYQLSGSAIGGADQFYSGDGNDEIWGDGILTDAAQGGRDKFYFKGSFGEDTIHDFRAGEDRISIKGTLFADATIETVGTDTVISTLSDDSITLKDFTGTLTIGVDLIFY